MAGRVKRTRRAVSCRQGQGKVPAAVGHLAMGSRDLTPSPQGLTKVAAAAAAAAAALLCQQVTDVDDVDVQAKGASTGSTRKESGSKGLRTMDSDARGALSSSRLTRSGNTGC